MLSRHQNDLVTQTDQETPGGKLLRSFWQPVATAEEMAPGKPPMPVRIMGEDLVLFRDPENRLGLIGLNCPHRGTDLSYGRIEDGGLRCLYHGWLFDIQGRCLEQPAERADSNFKDKIRHTAYPVQEKGGAIWAFLGEGAPPLIPDYAFLAAPADQRIVFRVVQDCNWVQGMEGSIDPSHTSFLHRITPPAPRAASDASPDPDHAGYFAEDTCPDLEIEKTRFGLRICTLRGLAKGERYLRVTNYLFPNGAAIVGAETAQNAGGYSGRWYVPIDDRSHCRFEFLYVTDEPIDVARFRARRASEIGPDSRHIRNAANRYMQDRGEMATQTFAGMGKYFPAHDAFAIETPGAIQDRTKEHLGRTDMAVIEMRKAILEAIRIMQEGGAAPGVVRDAAENDFPELMVFGDFIAPGVSGAELCRQRLAQMKAAAE
jgi:phenylpropionate dioxygenase-like ring-hydroxylating dioxygenase large terminal subunit